MASSFSTPLQPRQLSSVFPCKSRFNFNAIEFQFAAHCLTPLAKNTPNFVAKTPNSSYLAKLSTAYHSSTKPTNSGAKRKSISGLRSSGSGDDRIEKESLKDLVSSLVKNRAQKGSSQNRNLERLSNRKNAAKDNNFKHNREIGNVKSDAVGGNEAKKSKRNKVDSPEFRLRIALEQCSKRGDFMGAIDLYDSTRTYEIQLGQYHFTVLLYLCSSASVGIVQPAKSGSGSRNLKNLELVSKDSSNDSMESDDDFGNQNFGDSVEEGQVIRLSEDMKNYALKRGFDIYHDMNSQNIPMNEATLTSVARMAMSMGDGNKAFDMVKQMKPLDINPRLRSYGPALSAFVKNGDVEKAFEVEKHMLDHGVYPEEPELELLLRVSVAASKGDKVYYLLHKLRTSVRKVSPSTADLMQKWFESSVASKIGKRKWDQKVIKEAVRNSGGGWHGQGWLGKGKWNVSRSSVRADGLCRCCGEKLALIDLDPVETENFAESVAAIAIKRERNSSFQKFQKWLDYYGPFEAVIDAANVGLFGQQRFLPSRVNTVVNGIWQKLPSKRWPLIVLHNRRVTGRNMDQPINRTLIDKWTNADALYSTPTGSNDDWYWLYAAIKFKCLLVTNDEMRDHTFQLLGNDFFPKWKERHQVHFSFSNAGPEFHMPPPCSVVVQESENGNWHIPILSGDEYEADRTWLCVTRTNSGVATEINDVPSIRHSNEHAAPVELGPEPKPTNKTNHPQSKNPPQKTCQNLREIFAASVSSKLEASESVGNCVIDFQI